MECSSPLTFTNDVPSAKQRTCELVMSPCPRSSFAGGRGRGPYEREALLLEVFDQHQVAGATGEASEENGLAIRRDGEVHMPRPGRKMLESSETAIFPAYEIDGTKRRPRGWIARDVNDGVARWSEGGRSDAVDERPRSRPPRTVD